MIPLAPRPRCQRADSPLTLAGRCCRPAGSEQPVAAAGDALDPTRTTGSAVAGAHDAPMGWQQLLAWLVVSLAWPMIGLVAIYVFRDSIAAAISHHGESLRSPGHSQRPADRPQRRNPPIPGPSTLAEIWGAEY
jgi:hypothetical protein